MSINPLSNVSPGPRPGPVDLLPAMRATLSAALEQRQRAQDSIRQVKETCTKFNRDPSAGEAGTVRAAVAERDRLDETINQLQTKINDTAGAKEQAATAEANLRAMNPGYFEHGDQERSYQAAHTSPQGGASAIYRRELDATGTRSYFLDLYDSEVRHDAGARARLDAFGAESRAVGTGAGGGLVIPNYLLDLIAPVIRAGRPFASSCQHEELPDAGVSITIPQGTVGTTTASQVTENSAVSDTDAAWQPLTVPIVTIAGQADLSRQLLERAPGVDQVVTSDLALSYAAELDRQTLSGSGASGQMLGVLNTAGAAQATAFTAAVNVQTFWQKIAGAIAAVSAARQLPPTHIAMSPRRLAWLLGQVDSQGRPLVVPGTTNVNGMGNAPTFGTDGATGMVFAGLEVVQDSNIPTSVGSGPEDVVIVYRAADLLLWEHGDGTPTGVRYDQTLAGQLTSKIVLYGYVAFTANRYPQAVAKVGGNSAAGFGLISPVW